MGFFDSLNPSNLFGGGGGGGGDASASGGDPVMGAAMLGVGNADTTRKPFDPNQAYGFGTAAADQGSGGTSKFDQMRRQQFGAGGSSQGG